MQCDRIRVNGCLADACTITWQLWVGGQWRARWSKQGLAWCACEGLKVLQGLLLCYPQCIKLQPVTVFGNQRTKGPIFSLWHHRYVLSGDYSAIMYPNILWIISYFTGCDKGQMSMLIGLLITWCTEPVEGSWHIQCRLSSPESLLSFPVDSNQERNSRQCNCSKQEPGSHQEKKHITFSVSISSNP